ncbi:NPP1 family protein [Marinobacter sp. JSM 1782161]|uniref:NPP1 family protein n=1 Tax=Marinobacter sp. JSM 1782161 TaxID=2685906 RepID=UPI001401EE5D|nr:NPP1 family protein [Marinobacter sp. JSM 1782161]
MSSIRFGFLIPALALSPLASADSFIALEQALPSGADAARIAPVFDFDTDGCLPSAGISRSGAQNGGLNPSGSLTGGCRDNNFLDTSNTLHRYACITSGGSEYCGHFFSLYFLKDQILAGIQSGHRHDWEHAAVWTTNGVVTHGSYSAHGDMTTDAIANLPQQNGHLKIVYHKDGVATHALRFAKTDEAAENPYGSFVTPVITSWYTMTGDGVANATLRNNLNSFDYGSASVPMRDDNFLGNLNEARPGGYPAFTAANVQQTQ